MTGGDIRFMFKQENAWNRMDSQGKTPKLLGQVRQVMRLHHYSLHTERRDCQSSLLTLFRQP